jgi:eukaryotic-like serine/threonine-protein kinase
MRESPPPQLVALLERLGLATAAQVGRMAGRVCRLAGELPRFESVWVDALAQARVLTPFQAAEINAGRGEQLRIGPFVLCERLTWPDCLPCYRARRLDRPETVRLAVAQGAGQCRTESYSVIEERRSGTASYSHCQAGWQPAPRPKQDSIIPQFQALAAVAENIRSEHVAAVTEAGQDGDRMWAAAPWVEGRLAAQWMVHNGRFPAEVVLEIARQMAAGLVALERAGLCHGDLSAAGLTLAEGGRVVLLLPGVRAIVRPAEGYSHTDLPPEAFDYLAPERVATGTPPNAASDAYACGCVWWHLLCGRPPLTGGDSLAKLRAAQAGEIHDLRRFAPEVPGPLDAAISTCVQREPGRRPESMARLVATLGPSTRSGRIALARCLADEGRPHARLSMRPAFLPRGYGKAGPSRHWWTAGAVCVLVALAAVLWPVWTARLPLPTASIRGEKKGETATGPSSRSVNPRETPSDETPVPVLPAAPPRDLVLSADKPIDGQSLKLLTGQRVRGTKGLRPVVLVPPGGLIVSVEDVRFEGLDFVWQHAAEAGKTGDPPAAVIQLRAARIAFHGCRFQAGPTATTLPAAIAWTHPTDAQAGALSLPSGRVQLSDCVLQRVSAGIDCRTAGALTVDLNNTLFLGSGPLVRLDHCPGGDEPVLLNVAQVTLRGSGPLLECRYPQIEVQPGEIAIQATGSVFAPAANMPLVRFSGSDDPERLLQNLRWTGQGSLVTPATAIAAWQGSQGSPKTLDDALVSIAGLVRSEVVFAGGVQAGPAASRAQRWQAPLQSADPPGIDPKPLAGEFDNARR